MYRLAGALLLLLALTACAAAGLPVEVERSDWFLHAIGDDAVIAGSSITLRFEEGTAGGNSNCNLYGAEYEASGRTIRFGELRSTLRACLDQAKMEEDARYFDALRQVARFSVDGQTLQFESAEGRPLLLFRRVAAQ